MWLHKASHFLCADRAEAKKRQEQRKLNKKTQAEAAKLEAAQKARIQRQQIQQKRSAVFAAARHGNSEAVKKGIWEDSVDAAGGEVKPGHEEFAVAPPQDPGETLLHIAAANAKTELVEWLIDHSNNLALNSWFIS